MLISRCPDLEELSIQGTHPNPADGVMLIKGGRWPKLRKLYLGDVVREWLMAAPPTPDTKSPFIIFLEAHPALHSLSISRHAIDPSQFSEISPDALGNLRDFEGSLYQLRALPSTHSSLKKFSFRDPMPTSGMTPLDVAGVLQGLHSLTDLQIVFIVRSTYDSGTLLRSIVLLPNLQHLDLTFAHHPSLRLVRPQ